MKSLRNRLAKWTRKTRVLSDQNGVAAIEFALLLPFLLLLYLGGVEILQGILIQRQATLTATTVANIVGQYTSISASTQMPDILNAAVQIFAPNPAANANVVVSLITIDGNGSATVTWSQALTGSGRAKGPITVPSTLDIPSTSLLFSEATYAYTPVVDFIHMGTKNLYASIYMVPRASTTINQVP
jgi:Flp pilus assembly protein TadG